MLAGRYEFDWILAINRAKEFDLSDISLRASCKVDVIERRQIRQWRVHLDGPGAFRIIPLLRHDSGIGVHLQFSGLHVRLELL